MYNCYDVHVRNSHGIIIATHTLCTTQFLLGGLVARTREERESLSPSLSLYIKDHTLTLA